MTRRRSRRRARPAGLLGARRGDHRDRAVVAQAIATCDVVTSELLYSTRNVGEFHAQRGRLARLPFCPIGPPQWERAFDVWQLFAAEGGLDHRRVRLAGCLIAAAAEHMSLPVLHYDADFDAIAAHTGQPVRAIVPVGSL